LRSEEVVNWATRGGTKAIGLDGKIGNLKVGKKANILLIKNDESPTMFPILNPYGHIALQASRVGVHTVVIDGRIVKHELDRNDPAIAQEVVGNTIDRLGDQLGEEVWVGGMN
jgi:5-methylthioadenosine/S-adenosylhomocysteine deaminase